MKFTKLTASAMLILSCGLGCGDDGEDDGTGGSGGGETGGTGGTDETGGTGGTDETGGTGGTDETGGTGGTTETGGAGGASPMCDPPSNGGQGGAGGASGQLDIAGTYTDDAFGSTWTLSSDLIEIDDSTIYVTAITDGDRVIVGKNDEGNMFGPCMFSRFDFYMDGDTLRVCGTTFDAETEAEALGVEPPDSDNLESGCNGYPWSTLTPE